MVDPRPSLDSLLAGCEGVVGLEGDGDLRPTAVVEDSRDAVPGSLFVARPGSSDDGTRFLESAVERGATAVLVGAGAPVPGSVARRVAACVRAEDPAGLGSELAHRFHGSPAASLPVVAVTGTNGQTTVAWFVRALFAAAGRRCGLVGTIEVDDGATHTPAA
ncbi:MAG: Mur ligase domain-containing protein, partial [Planctomycetota bacterium]|nr:Mur ligase domain-containing protein [Planctomycetota bacterium]